jgi:hypothetical protein
MRLSNVNQRIPVHDVDLSRPKAHHVNVPPTKDAKRQVAYRLPADLVARIGRYQAKLAADLPGMDVTQANAVRVLLEKALAAEGFPAREPAGKAPKRGR